MGARSGRIGRVGRFSREQELDGIASSVENILIGQNKFELNSHTIARMLERGITKTEIENVLKNKKPFRYYHDGVWKNGFYDAKTKIFIAELNGKILTVIKGVEENYIQNLKGAKP